MIDKILEIIRERDLDLNQDDLAEIEILMTDIKREVAEKAYPMIASTIEALIMSPEYRGDIMDFDL